MIILSFDVAMSNLGVVLLEYKKIEEKDLLYVKKTIAEVSKMIINHDPKINSKVDQKGTRNIQKMLEECDKLMREFNIIWYSNVSLQTYEDVVVKTRKVKIDGEIKHKKLKKDKTVQKPVKMSFEEKAASLKSFLTHLDRTIPEMERIDYVLIENQMKQNDMTRLMASQIMYHYTPVYERQHDIKVCGGSYEYEIDIWGNSLTDYDLESGNDDQSDEQSNKHSNDQSDDENNDKPKAFPRFANKIKKKVIFVNPKLKNKYYTTEKGKYENFVSKKSSKDKKTNYAANKKHAVYNFMHFMQNVRGGCDLNEDNFKLDDIADAFMMAYGWIIENNKKLP